MSDGARGSSENDALLGQVNESLQTETCGRVGGRYATVTTNMSTAGQVRFHHSWTCHRREECTTVLTSLRFFGIALVLAFFWKADAISNLREVIRSREALIMLVLAEVVLVPLAILLLIKATKLGPVSLVATITGTRAISILFYSTILSLPKFRVLNESLDSRSLTVKVVSVSMIIGGVISLSVFAEDRFACFCPY